MAAAHLLPSGAFRSAATPPLPPGSIRSSPPLLRPRPLSASPLLRRTAAAAPPRALVYGGAASRAHDPELRLVFELATDEELFDLEDILFGTSYFSPVLKSITNKPGLDYSLCTEDIEERENFIERLESRFLFLAADARSTLSGWRPSYRNVLLAIRRKLRIRCSSNLSTEDLEVEIFLHLLDENSSQVQGVKNLPWHCLNFSADNVNFEIGLNKWKMHTFAALKAGAEEAQQFFLKGGGILTIAKLYQLLARRLCGKMLMEAANYQIKHELLKKGGNIAAINLESRAALLAARMGFARAASRYIGLRSLMTLLGPALWGAFLADVVIQMLGTDYARILRAIYAFAQIRLTRTYGWTTAKN